MRCCPVSRLRLFRTVRFRLSSPATLDRAVELAGTAVCLDAGLPQAHAQLGHVLVFKRQHDAAIAEFERAFALNPNFIDHRFAWVLLYAGEPTRAIEVLQANIVSTLFSHSSFAWCYGHGQLHAEAL